MNTNRFEGSNSNGRKFFLRGSILAMYVLIVAGALFMQAVSAQAMDRMGRGPSPEQIASDLKERLGLTAEQEAQILPIIKDDMGQHHEILEKSRQQASENRDAVKAELEVIESKTDAKLATILSAEQMKEFQKLREERRMRMRHRQHRGERH